MKSNWLVGTVFLAGAMVLRAQTNDLSAALQKGLFEEEANRNLDAAISDYQALAMQFDRDRQIAATAIFRLGECYRKLGQTNDAIVQYQRILREFSDQQTLATLSRQNLTGLGVASQPLFQERLQAIIKKNPQDATASTTGESAAKAAELEAEAAALKVQVDRLSGLKRDDCRIAIQQNFSNPVLTKLMQDLTDAQQKLAVLTNDYALEDLHVTRVTGQMNAINAQIDAQVNGVIGGLQAKMEVDLDAAKALRDKSGPVPAVPAEAATTTDDEDQEIRRIQQLIQNSPDLINVPPSANGVTPLRNAVLNGQIKVVTFLLDHDAGVNVDQGDGSTVLHDAARVGNRAMAELLLSRGADVNAKAVNGKTPLYLAVENSFQTVAEFLLANKAEVNVSDKNAGNMPLHLAAKNGQAKIIQMLLAAGANPEAENKVGRTPLSFAAGSGSLEAVKMLLNAKTDPNGGKLDAPLLAAIHKQDVASVELLLENGANPNLKGGMEDRPEVTPLYLAISTGQLPMVNLLLKFKADPNDSQTDGMPLSFSALSNPDILGALLDAGGKVDSHVSGGLTLLDHAVNGNSPVAPVEVLLKHGADPNARDSRGNTSLYYAVWGAADPGKIALLLNHHADPNVRNNEGQTPLDIVKGKLAQYIAPGDKAPLGEIADLLRSHGALDNLPNWDRITVSRPSANYSQTVFQKGTNDWNRFTLLETFMKFYPEQSFNPPQFRGGADSGISLPFPDLTRVTIIRHQQNTTNEMRIKVDLLNATNGIDCSRDVPLEFGDVVEIPEREHTLGDQPVGLTDSQCNAIVNGLKGSVRLEVRGAKVELPVYPNDNALIGSVFNRPEAQATLLSSSDLSRVKVTRVDPATGKKREWILDCSHMSKKSNLPFFPGQSDNPHYNAPDLRLCDGDVIEVPEKQN